MSTFLFVVSFLAAALVLLILAVVAVICSKAQAYRQQLADEISGEAFEQESRESGDRLATWFSAFA